MSTKTETKAEATAENKTEKTFMLRNRDIRGQTVLTVANESMFLPPKGKKKIREDEVSEDMKRLRDLGLLALDEQ